MPGKTCFSYEYVREQYEMAVLTGKMAGFMQELMLRITSEEERLVQDNEIRWYSRSTLIENKSAFNFYITTDFATSAKQTELFSYCSLGVQFQRRLVLGRWHL